MNDVKICCTRRCETATTICFGNNRKSKVFVFFSFSLFVRLLLLLSLSGACIDRVEHLIQYDCIDVCALLMTFGLHANN